MAQPDTDSNHIKVCVRCRPFNQREKDERTTLCVSMPNKEQVIMTDMAGAKKTFNLDRSYWSHKTRNANGDPDPNFATQETLMLELGNELESNALQGYNSCLFAYGQTGSGKTYSVLGSPDPPELRGLLPRMVEDLFGQIEVDTAKGVEFKCSVTYFEIYNEVIKDLLCPTSEKLDVRSNPTMGVYVQGLKDVPVFNKTDVQKLLDFGAKARTMGATCMNDQSSRSHCIFTVEIISKRALPDGTSSQLRAKLNLVDLAGSERQAKTQASGERLKEGSSINKSLSSLAMCISKLAELSAKSHSAKGKKDDFVPFRNSKLTHCLQDSLSGNSRTVMMAALSPALSNYEETLSTLRFAQSVKSIKTKARKNEESEEALVQNLKAECERLKKLMADGKGNADELASVQAMAEKYGEGFEAKLATAAALEQQRQEFLEDAGLTLEEMAASVGIKKETPQLVNLCTDPSLSGCLVYFLVSGEEVTCGSAAKSKIVLDGLGMTELMAVITNQDDITVKIKTVDDGRVLVNGARVSTETDLRHGDRLILGYSFCFRVVVPLCTEAQESQAKDKTSLEDALGEVVPVQSEAYQQCRVYVEDLQSRVGATRAQHFLMQFQKAMTMVEEANVISQTLRRKDRFKFNVEVVVDTFQYQQDEPECVVRLKKYLTGIRRFKDVITRNIIEPNRAKRGNAFMNLISGLRGRAKTNMAQTTTTAQGSKPPSPEPFETVAVWELASFKMRMTHIREAYESYQEHKTVDFSKPEDDPWRVIEPWQLGPMMDERQSGPAALTLSTARTPEEKASILQVIESIPIEDLPQLTQLRESHGKELDFYKGELDKCTRELQRNYRDSELQAREKERSETEKLAYQEERLSWENADKAKEAKFREQSVRIQDLERQLERQRAEASEAREQLRYALTSDPRNAGSPATTAPSEVRLRHASEESAVAAHLATKLLGSLRDIKGDLRSSMASKDNLRTEVSPGESRANRYARRV